LVFSRSCLYLYVLSFILPRLQLVHPIPGPFFNTGISVLKNVNTGYTGIIPVLKLKKKIDQIIRDFLLFLIFFL
jgi:hypothetical protein